MATNYLYLDDDKGARTSPLVARVEGTQSDLHIQVEHPGKYQKGLADLVKDLTKYDGLILDWQLDDALEPQLGVISGFRRAGTVAQEIRTQTTEGRLTAIPIVIWSTQQKLRKSYDQTSEDLFDDHYDKDSIDEQSADIRLKLISLANGYKTLRQFRGKKVSSILKIQEDEIDIRLLQKLNDKSLPVHQQSRFIIKELLERPGVLISQDLLMARLGVDSKKSSDLPKLLLALEPYRYTGPFGEAWGRWWANGVERVWWSKLKNVSQSPSFLTAGERIKIINSALRLKLVAAKPIEPKYQTRFSTICEHFKQPLDPIDGVIIDEDDPEPWQERRYLSLKAAMKRLSEPEIKPHPIEHDRLKALRRSGG